MYDKLHNSTLATSGLVTNVRHESEIRHGLRHVTIKSVLFTDACEALRRFRTVTWSWHSCWWSHFYSNLRLLPFVGRNFEFILAGTFPTPKWGRSSPSSYRSEAAIGRQNIVLAAPARSSHEPLWSQLAIAAWDTITCRLVLVHPTLEDMWHLLGKTKRQIRANKGAKAGYLGEKNEKFCLLPIGLGNVSVFDFDTCLSPEVLKYPPRAKT